MGLVKFVTKKEREERKKEAKKERSRVKRKRIKKESKEKERACVCMRARGFKVKMSKVGR